MFYNNVCIYTVPRPVEYFKMFFFLQLSLDKVLKLQIPEMHDEGLEMRRYCLEDLRELQNKLMLMSGKGDQGQNEVDQFAEVGVNF